MNWLSTKKTSWWQLVYDTQIILFQQTQVGGTILYHWNYLKCFVILCWSFHGKSSRLFLPWCSWNWEFGIRFWKHQLRWGTGHANICQPSCSYVFLLCVLHHHHQQQQQQQHQQHHHHHHHHHPCSDTIQHHGDINMNMCLSHIWSLLTYWRTSPIVSARYIHVLNYELPVLYIYIYIIYYIYNPIGQCSESPLSFALGGQSDFPTDQPSEIDLPPDLRQRSSLTLMQQPGKPAAMVFGRERTTIEQEWYTINTVCIHIYIYNLSKA